MSPPLYDSGTIISGTNTPNPSPACVAITLNGGDFDLTSYSGGTATVTINDMVINGVCHTGPFTGTISGSPAKLDVPPTITPCGAIEGHITVVSPTPTSVVP